MSVWSAFLRPTTRSPFWIRRTGSSRPGRKRPRHTPGANHQKQKKRAHGALEVEALQRWVVDVPVGLMDPDVSHHIVLRGEEGLCTGCDLRNLFTTGQPVDSSALLSPLSFKSPCPRFVTVCGRGDTNLGISIVGQTSNLNAIS